MSVTQTQTNTAGGLASGGRQMSSSNKKIDFSPVLNRLRSTFKSGKTKDLAWRREQLQNLRRMITENMETWTEAVVKDLGRSKAMAVFGDLNDSVNACDYCLDNLETWAKDRKRPIKLELFPGKAYQHPEPKGVILNIAPWNFPVTLCANPLAYVIAAGNCGVIKPSEISENVSKTFADLIPKYMDQDCFACIEGGVPETTALLELQWDHILYTGNNFVAKIVMAAAAKHLTPVTLELGGKSPVLIDQDCNIKQAVKRVLNVKTINCGQICLAPDYVLLHKSQEEAFYAEVEAVMAGWYPNGQENDPSYARIINGNHWKRIKALLDDNGGEVVHGGLDKCNQADNLFVTTVVKNPKLTSRIMKEEIFGPLLPVVTVDSMEDAVKVVSSIDHPLGLYIFSNSKKTVDWIIQNTTSGGVTVNDCMMHIVVEELPFGGVGPSGMGCVHGQAGFDEFSHLRSVLDRGTGSLDLLAQARYPPHDEAKYNLLTKMTKNAHGIKKAIGNAVKVGVPVLMAVAGFYARGYFM